MARISRELGNTTAADYYASRAGESRASFGSLYFDKTKGVFRDPKIRPEDGPEVFQTEQALGITLALDLQDAYSAPGSGEPVEIVAPADVARAASALAANVQGQGAAHVGTGMVGIKYLLPALTATGYGDVALAALSARDYPGFGYMVAQGEGTLWEHFEGDQHIISGSRNHIMLGSPGQWMLQGLGGVALGRGAVAWDRVTIQPLAAAAMSGSGLGGVDVTVGTPRGAITAVWRTTPDGEELCGEGEEKDDEGTPVTLSCGASGKTIASIDFASYGTPTGSCAGGSGPMSKNASCDAPTALSVVEAACIGKSECTLYANNTQFGGQDPCPGMRKRLLITATCSGGSIRFVLNSTIPFGSVADTVLPVPSAVKTDSVVVEESGNVVFANSSFVPGAAEGVVSASLTKDGVSIVTGGGQYAFVLLY